MIKNRQECYPFVVLSPISPNVSDGTPVFFSFYDRNGRSTTWQSVYVAVMTILPSKTSSTDVKNVTKRSFANRVWQSRSEPSKLLTAFAVHIAAISTSTKTLSTDGENLTDPDIDSVAIGTVFKKATSFQKRG